MNQNCKNGKSISQPPANEETHEDDGYDYIGQIDLNQEGLLDVVIEENTLPTNQNENLNTIEISQNPYYEGTMEIGCPAKMSDMNQIEIGATEHMTRKENPYYEGI